MSRTTRKSPFPWLPMTAISIGLVSHSYALSNLFPYIGYMVQVCMCVCCVLWCKFVNPSSLAYACPLCQVGMNRVLTTNCSNIRRANSSLYAKIPSKVQRASGTPTLSDMFSVERASRAQPRLPVCRCPCCHNSLKERIDDKRLLKRRHTLIT